MQFDTYTTLLSELARRHKEIAATAENGRFQQLFLSSDLVQKQIDLTSFSNSTRSGLKAPEGQCYLVAENYQLDFDDNQGDYLTRKFRGACLVLARAAGNKLAARQTTVAHCEQVAQQLLGALVYLLREEHDAHVTVADAWLEHIGPLADASVGVRLSFGWQEPASEDLVYNPTHFID